MSVCIEGKQKGSEKGTHTRIKFEANKRISSEN